MEHGLTFNTNDVFLLPVLALFLRLLNGQSVHIFEHARLKVHGLDLYVQESEPCDQQALDYQAASKRKNAEDELRCES
jgi:hypothetical protein